MEKDNDNIKIRKQQFCFVLLIHIFKCVHNNNTYFPPHATTMNQLNMNNLLCHINETIIKNESKGEIGLIVDDISPVLRYLFPVKEKEINLKW